MKRQLGGPDVGGSQPGRCGNFMEKDISVIPEGQYCYDYSGPGNTFKACPYWSWDPTKPEQENGHCSFLGYGDWEEEHLSLLWDQVKECRIKND